MQLCERLLNWFERSRRDLPWRRTRDPYQIWVSEVMLAQTRVETVVPYYQRFLSAFPSAEALAAAPLDEVLKAWEGLGYYARARNLHRAVQILAQRGEAIPRTREALLALPGVGPYTAGAIASIAFGERCAAVDGNVERVLARLYAEDGESSTVWARAQAMVAQTADASAHNQALMELGATVCTPRQPRCDACPLAGGCKAREMEATDSFPRKAVRKFLPQRDMCAGLVWDQGLFLIVRRPEDGLLGGLWDLPAASRRPREQRRRACGRGVAEQTGSRVRVGSQLAFVQHVFTHFKMHLYVFDCILADGVGETECRRWISPGDLASFAFGAATRRIFDILDPRLHSTW